MALAESGYVDLPGPERQTLAYCATVKFNGNLPAAIASEKQDPVEGPKETIMRSKISFKLVFPLLLRVLDQLLRRGGPCVANARKAFVRILSAQLN